MSHCLIGGLGQARRADNSSRERAECRGLRLSLRGYNPVCKVTPVILHGVASSDARDCWQKLNLFLRIVRGARPLLASAEARNHLALSQAVWTHQCGASVFFAPKLAGLCRKPSMSTGEYRGTSLMRNTHPRMIAIGLQAQGYCRILLGEGFL